jgi:esterase/lipase superfamily enzyme
MPLPPRAPGGRGDPAKPDPGGTEQALAVVPVFYATDRARIRPGEYSGERNKTGSLQFGVCEVSIPRDHRLAVVERPTIWTLYTEIKSRHLIIASRQELPQTDFRARLQQVVDKSATDEAFVFVHGFNTAFDDAIYRTAQLAYDMGFDGAPITYSWPSAGGVLRYGVDLNNNEWTVSHLTLFLSDLAVESGAKKIHLIAHSMGNRALTYALNRLTAGRTMFKHIALTAPDIDADVFHTLAGAVTKRAHSTTLYVSRTDRALAVSKAYQKYRRAGDANEGITIIPGIDTVDVSELDTSFLGHSYYGDNRSVLTDLIELLRNDLAPAKRAFLRMVGAPPNTYWAFKR